jgi:hypothetical protein
MPLSDPVPSTALDVAQKNFETLDELVNSSSATNRVGNSVNALSNIDRVTEDAPSDGWAYALKEGVWQRYAQINYINGCGESYMECGEVQAECGAFDGFV